MTVQNNLPDDRITEIKNHFNRGDIDLGRRRFLDLIYDQNNEVLLQQAVDWSRRFTASSDTQDKNYQGALDILKAVQFAPPNDSVDTALVTAENITKQFRQGGFTLKNIHIELTKGNILGVVGENGNGKTTLLRCIAGQLDAGIEESAYHFLPKENQYFYTLKEYTGFIPQRIPKWYGKLQDNLHFTASISGIMGRKNQLMVDFVLERFGLTKYAALTWNQISSGYRTRFEIARIVLKRPQLLILDEPLANLDINAQQTLLQDLRYIAKSALHPMGVIITSQQLYEIEKVSDSVLFIQNGNGIYNEVAIEISEEKAEDIPKSIIEFECKNEREEIDKALGQFQPAISFNGGVYQIRSMQEAEVILKSLIQNNVHILYYRDITKSTKRFF